MLQGDLSGHDCGSKGNKDRQEMVRHRVCHIWPFLSI